MKSPITGKEMSIVKRLDKLTYRKEEFEIMYHAYVDSENDLEFTDTKLDELNTCQLYNAYREKYQLPFPEEIKAIRSSYGLPANKMAEVLGFGVNVYRNYENGEIPSESNARLIQLARDPHEFKKLLKLSKVYAPAEVDLISMKIDKLIHERKRAGERAIESYLMGGVSSPNEFNGYRVPSLERFMHMVVFFAERVKPWKVKLNKLLFYADFMHYMNYCQSISGGRYMAIQRGPVIKRFDALFGETADRGLVEIHYELFEDKGGEFKEGVGQQFRPIDSQFNPELFSESELKTLDAVVQKFGGLSTAQIVNTSHQELAWIENAADRSDISYKYSFKLNQQ